MDSRDFSVEVLGVDNGLLLITFANFISPTGHTGGKFYSHYSKYSWIYNNIIDCLEKLKAGRMYIK